MSELTISTEPVFTLTLNDAEVRAFRNLIGHTNSDIRKEYITEEEEHLLYKMYGNITSHFSYDEIETERRAV